MFTRSLAAACIIAAPAMAQEDDLVTCATLGETAHQIMTFRQAEYPVADLLARVQTVEGPAGKLATAMILQAYSQPRWASPARQERAAAEFDNLIVIECLKSRGED